MKIYAVKQGRIPGLYNTWDECKLQVNGYKGALYKSFTTITEANQYMEIITYNPLHQSLNNQIILTQKQTTTIIPYSPSIYVDGGHGSYSGDEAWACIVDNNKTDLIANHLYLFNDMQYKQVDLPSGIRYVLVSKFSDVKSQQNNGAELLAMIGGMRIALYTNSYKTLFSDSNLCVEYWSKKLSDSKRSSMDPNKVKYIDELILLRLQYESLGGVVNKISGSDNLADLGYH